MRKHLYRRAGRNAEGLWGTVRYHAAGEQVPGGAGGRGPGSDGNKPEPGRDRSGTGQGDNAGGEHRSRCAALTDLTEKTGGIGQDLATTAGDMAQLGQDTEAVADSLVTINEELAQFVPSIDEHLATVNEVNDSVTEMRVGIGQLTRTARLVIAVAMLWIAISQVTPLALGWSFVAEENADQIAGQG